MRHIEVRELWLQEEVRLGRVRVERINGKENPADLMTKYLRAGEVVERLRRMGLAPIFRPCGPCPRIPCVPFP